MGSGKPYERISIVGRLRKCGIRGALVAAVWLEATTTWSQEPDLDSKLVLANLDKHPAHIRVDRTRKEIPPQKATVLSPKAYPVSFQFFTGVKARGWHNRVVTEPGVYAFDWRKGGYALRRLSPRETTASSAALTSATTRNPGGRSAPRLVDEPGLGGRRIPRFANEPGLGGRRIPRFANEPGLAGRRIPRFANEPGLAGRHIPGVGGRRLPGVVGQVLPSIGLAPRTAIRPVIRQGAIMTPVFTKWSPLARMAYLATHLCRFCRDGQDRDFVRRLLWEARNDDRAFPRWLEDADIEKEIKDELERVRNQLDKFTDDDWKEIENATDEDWDRIKEEIGDTLDQKELESVEINLKDISTEDFWNEAKDVNISDLSSDGAFDFGQDVAVGDLQDTGDLGVDAGNFVLPDFSDDSGADFGDQDLGGDDLEGGDDSGAEDTRGDDF